MKFVALPKPRIIVKCVLIIVKGFALLVFASQSQVIFSSLLFVYSFLVNGIHYLEVKDI